jgi:hypothetical protein
MKLDTGKFYKKLAMKILGSFTKKLAMNINVG